MGYLCINRRVFKLKQYPNSLIRVLIWKNQAPLSTFLKAFKFKNLLYDICIRRHKGHLQYNLTITKTSLLFNMHTSDIIGKICIEECVVISFQHTHTVAAISEDF